MILFAAASISFAFSSSSAKAAKASATIVFNTMLGSATFACEPGIRNSNLLPVNANGDVRFLSVASFGNIGLSGTPILPFSALTGT